MWFYRDVATTKDGFNRGSHSFAVPFAVAVPSVIVPVWNVVLYPQGIGFWDHVALESVDAYEFDPRLFPEGAVVESSE
jgi:hypothetical protein